MPDAQLPRLDVVIAARNEARRLGECLIAIAAQHYPQENLRVTVVDNGSTDDTTAVAAAHGVRALREQLPGAAAARNRAVAEGDAELVAFLDAHCIVSPDWARLMVSTFTDPAVGGCQACIDSRADDPRLARFLQRSGVQSNARLLEDTVRGERNLYPWILTGNCVYRREALARAGGFDETLPACEDVDLAWRVVLLGYQLAYEGRAVAVHHSAESWSRFLAKGRRYGLASAILARRYLPRGAPNALRATSLRSRDPTRTLSALAYWVGYRQQATCLALRRSEPPSPAIPAMALPAFRLPFSWEEATSLQVSRDVVYWFRDDPASVVVHRPSRLRVVLDGSADVIWRALAGGSCRRATVAALVDRYGIAPQTAGADLDDLVDELIEAQILTLGPALA